MKKTSISGANTDRTLRLQGSLFNTGSFFKIDFLPNLYRPDGPHLIDKRSTKVQFTLAWAIQLITIRPETNVENIYMKKMIKDLYWVQLFWAFIEQIRRKQCR